MLIVTLPPISQFEQIRKMIAHPRVSAVRYNTGMKRDQSAVKILTALKKVCDKAGKRLMIDIKGRQLRITKTEEPANSWICLSHAISVDLPATVYLRNESEVCQLKSVDGNKILLDRTLDIVGEGQAINIVGPNMRIDGYLTDNDSEFLEATRQLGINDIVASYVEMIPDLEAIWSIHNRAKITAKIESRAGVSFVHSNKDLYSLIEKGACHLMTARDDLCFEYEMDIPVLFKIFRDIAIIDPEAILASRIFEGLRMVKEASLADYSDLILMKSFGYRNFLLGDNNSRFCFKESMKAFERMKMAF